MVRIGVDLGGTNLRVGVVDDDGRVIARTERPTPATEPPEAVIAAILELVRSLLPSGNGSSLRSVGVGSPGLVDHSAGIVRTSPNLPLWHDVPLRRELERALDIPVKVANDVNAMAWGEFLHGAGKGCRDILCITLGTGLGGGFVLGGELFTGKDQTAGEIGHFPLVRDGHPCPCGNRGCLEQYVARHGIVRRAREENPSLPPDATPESIAKAAERGEEWARRTYDVVAHQLAGVLAGVIQLFNLEKIIVGGKIARAGGILFDPLKRHMDACVYPFLRDKYSLEPAHLGEDAGIIGAAKL